MHLTQTWINSKFTFLVSFWCWGKKNVSSWLSLPARVWRWHTGSHTPSAPGLRPRIKQVGRVILVCSVGPRPRCGKSVKKEMSAREEKGRRWGENGAGNGWKKDLLAVASILFLIHFLRGKTCIWTLLLFRYTRTHERTHTHTHARAHTHTLWFLGGE